MLIPLYTLAVFLNAAVLFTVEPLFAKLALPLLGGTPSVWNTSLMFFQATLLLGYLYVHVTTRFLTLRGQMLVHGGLALVSLVALPLQLRASGDPPTGGFAILWLVGVLAMSLGLPFAVLSAGAPLLQRWFAASGHSRAADPYFLYAASNLGSLLALLAYPLVLEPTFPLSVQRGGWSVAYGVVLALVGVCAWTVARRPGAVAAASASTPVADSRDAVVTWRDRLLWIAYAAVPSSLLMGVTSFVSTDVAAIPLLWVVPLSLYLLTFVFAFARRTLLPHALMLRIEPLVLIPVALIMAFGLRADSLIAMICLHFALLFVVAMTCHGELARRRPVASALTEFYLWMSVGGLVGGVFNAVVAPLVFDRVWEYAIALVAAGFLRSAVARASDREPAPDAPRMQRTWIVDLAVSLALGVLVWLLTSGDASPMDGSPLIRAVLLGAVVISLLASMQAPRRFGLLLATYFVATAPLQTRNVLHTDRSFFGVYRVMNAADGGVRELIHGTTVHGAQSTNRLTELSPRTYYHRDGPVGDIFRRTAAGTLPVRHVYAVGLGVGSIACYGRAAETWTFFEIDPVVERIARDPRYFTFLRDCPPQSRVVIGDARLTLRDMPPASADLLVLDAFSSDAIPVHLLTREAFDLYDRVLAPNGLIAIHISNRHVELEPVIAATAAARGFLVRIRTDAGLTPEQRERGRLPSEWVVLSRAEADLGQIAQDERWRITNGRTSPWTDDYSNVLRAAFGHYWAD